MADDSQLKYEDEPGETTANQQPQAQPVNGGSDLPLKEGALFGVGGFLLSYLSVFALVQGTISMGGVDTDNLAATWEIAAWFLLAGLGAEFEIDGETASVFAIFAEDILDLEVGLLLFQPEFAILIPIVVLIGAGYSLAKYTGAEDSAEAAQASALAVPGWLLLAVVFSFLSSWESENETTFAIVTSDAILFAGILMPAIFAIAGGLLYAWPDPVEQLMEKIE